MEVEVGAGDYLVGFEDEHVADVFGVFVQVPDLESVGLVEDAPFDVGVECGEGLGDGLDEVDDDAAVDVDGGGVVVHMGEHYFHESVDAGVSVLVFYDVGDVGFFFGEVDDGVLVFLELGDVDEVPGGKTVGVDVFNMGEFFEEF